MTRKSQNWRILFVLMSAAYLIPEAIFNAQLVSLIGLGTPNPDLLKHLEIYGRSISGIGVGLLIADLLPAVFYRSALRGGLSLVVVVGLVWPSVFYGQKYIVEKWVIQPSSAGERQYAVFSTLLRDALVYDAVSISGVSYGPKERDSSEGLTFISLFGAMTYADHNLVSDLDKYEEHIVNNMVRKEAYANFETNYRDYSKIYKTLSADYQSYAQGSNRYNQALVDIPKRESSYWKEIDSQLKDGWSRYSKAQDAQISETQAKANKYAPVFYKYFKAKDSCAKRSNKTSCIQRLDNDYRNRLSSAGFDYVEPNYWLHKRKISTAENVGNSVLLGVATMGLYTAVQLLDKATGGDGGFKDYSYSYTNDPNFYREKMLALPQFQKSFKRQTGYPFGIKTYDNFRVQPQTQELLRDSFKEKGLDLPKDWGVNDRNGFHRSVADLVKREADQRWKKEMVKTGLMLPINLTWEQFQLAPSVQDKIAVQMGDLYVTNIRVDLNKANFKTLVVEPNIKKRVQHYIEMLNDNEHKFSDGGVFAEKGKQALRSIIIPPISMSLSLFLICATLLKMPLKVVGLFKSGVEPIRSGKWIRIALKLVPLIALVIVPPLVVHNRFTDDPSNPVNYFLKKVSASSNELVSYAIRWTLDVQPFLHPLGLVFEKHTHLYANFAPMADKLDKYDIDANKLGTEDELLKVLKAKLTVQSNVKNATVRIMNIGPHFEQGMRLDPGRYDIEVSAPGYQSQRGWYSLKAGSQTLKFELH
ncbi:hypothetical protein MSP8887_00568 [Marinomonas spartinae]|uniref:carboxypeptidase-like regulatory domain-containing protein n=1 Tax=Marinomonas spartinae TaxID=1792290 RepID=UPI000808BC1F|nr:carboxypeptidase-like regulatory domain-containing protein [Marinomonas spartinae]SBS27195.1 hypothetical protein MSP8887_00568 [Marinomonas spartinae]